MPPFHSTSKADFCVLKIPCVLKIFSKPRRVKNSPATGVRIQGTGTGNKLFPQWCLVRNREHLWAWWPREAAGG